MSNLEKSQGSSVSVGYAKSLLDFAVSKDAPRISLLERSGISDSALTNPDNRIPMKNFVILMKTCQELCHAPAFALEFSEQTKLVELSIVGLICQASQTMGAALMQLNRYASLIVEVDVTSDGQRFQMTKNHLGMWLEDKRTNPNEFPELTEAAFARFICEFRRHYSDTPFVKHIHVTHPKPTHHADYDRILNVPVTFDSDWNALLIDESCLMIPFRSSNNYVFGILSEHANNLLNELKNARSINAQVQSMLMPLLHTGEVNMEMIAKKMGLGRQTLYRQLKAEGTSFEKLLEDLRHKMALHYLGSKKVSANEAAYLVGFSDPSSFSRAFKRWTGSSPGHWQVDSPTH